MGLKTIPSVNKPLNAANGAEYIALSEAIFIIVLNETFLIVPFTNLVLICLDTAVKLPYQNLRQVFLCYLIYLL